MAETINTRGIVLYYRPWREYDRTYVIYTEACGKLICKAIGVRKPRAKLAGVLEPFAEIDVSLIMGKRYTVSGAVVSQRFAQMKQAKDRSTAAVYCAEVLDELVKDNVADPAVYQLLFSTFTWLDHAPYTKLIPISFVVKLIQLLGYQLPETKLIRWLYTAPFADIQKLRVQQADWQQLYQAVHLWLYEYCGDHVQSEQFLV
ncbi:MAG TPA: DNA repair protein RecO [Candidatus Kerfeldbacteria bacterium]|nr:DNA repair protein RecO [Candidatus Kerfeldbacteria bacterium]